MNKTMKKTYPRSLHQLADNTVEAWLFETLSERHRTEQLFKAKGKTIKLHSAYKTLVCEILENNWLTTSKTAIIRYPVVEGDEPLRFKIECYPLTDLVSAKLSFEPVKFNLTTSLPYYEIIADNEKIRIPVPVRWVEKANGNRQLVACGWLKTTADIHDGSPLFTEFEAIYQDSMDYLYAMEINQPPPFFECLTLDIGLPTKDTELPIANEHISLLEAMHEDIYFSALETFQHRLNLPTGDRGVAPGQVLPKPIYSEQPYLTITQHAATKIEGVDRGNLGGCPDLQNVGHWLTSTQIASHFQHLGGKLFSVKSRQHRLSQGCVINPTTAVANIAISAAQHANESSGVVGALRAAYTLKDSAKVAFTLCPCENVDGYAAFQTLCQDNPSHMQHAARYTAAGNDLTHGNEFECCIRQQAKLHLAADVHINLHGYPAHEWTRPLSGYVPQGFANWTIPKGFFLICRHQPGYEDLAMKVLNAAILAVAGYHAQMQQNKQMLRRYLSIVEVPNFQISHEVIPYTIQPQTNSIYPVEIITEAPDETVYGESFRIAHETQYRVILGIADALTL